MPEAIFTDSCTLSTFFAHTAMSVVLPPTSSEIVFSTGEARCSHSR
jgi:hypothetical protein